MPESKTPDPLSQRERSAKLEEMLNKAYNDDGFMGMIRTAIGAASVCWDTLEHAGTFRSEEALQINDIIVHYHGKEVRKAEDAVLRQMKTPHSIDAHSAKSGLFDPRKEEGDPE